MQPLWTLHGTGVLLLRNWRSAVTLIFYEDSPVGPYNEYAVIQIKHGGPSVTEMYVDSPESREAGRKLWGFPKELADLEWQSGGSHITFRKEQKYFRFRGVGFSIPFRAKTFTVQVLNGEKVRVPVEVSGQAGLAFRGKQLAIVLEEFEMQVFAPQNISDYPPPATDH